VPPFRAVQTVLVAIFWLWLLAALGVYAYRIFRRITQGPKAAREARLAEAETTSPSVPSSLGNVPLFPSAPPGAATPTAQGPITVPPPAQAAADEAGARAPTPSAPTKKIAPTVSLSSSGEAVVETPSPARTGFFAAPSDTDPGAAMKAPVPEGGEARKPVAELVSGIKMPCDLVPIVGDGRLDPFHVTFLTTGFAPESVGAQVGDELERLGFSLSSASPTAIVATRDGHSLAVTLHPDGSQVMVGDARAFPSAPAGSVVVELRS
jgi:hypothetical protein